MDRDLLVVDAPVDRVTVLEDRAEVTRASTVALPQGRSRLRLAAVAPVLADRTLRAVLDPGPAGAVVVDVRAVRYLRALREARPADVAALEDAVEDAAGRLESARRALALSRGEVEGLAELARRSLADARTAAAWGPAEPEVWRGRLVEAVHRELDSRVEVPGLQRVVRDLEREVADLRRRLAAAGGPGATRTCDVVVEVESPAPGEARLQVSYVVPGACWRPAHRIRRVAGAAGPAVAVETLACVWQNTGEDWVEARLAFSTRRPSLGLEPPLLDDDRLRSRPRAEQVVVEVRERIVEETRPGGRPALELPGIDDGGEVLALPAPRPATVRADGRLFRVPLAVFTADSEERLLVMAERAPAAVREVVFPNDGALPLLAGPVDLVEDGGPSGLTKVDFASPGARVRLGFGPDPAIRVRRRAERADHPPTMLQRQHRTEHGVAIHLSNLAAEPRALEVVERVPVSELEAVKVTVDPKQVTDGVMPDRDGFLRWKVTLDPGATRTIRLRWTLERKADVAGV